MMSEADIRKEYKEAADQDLQIEILADLNCTTARVIKRILSGETWEEARTRKPLSSSYVPKGAYKHWTISDLEFLRQKRDEGYTTRQIAEMMGTNSDTIRSTVSRYRDFFPLKQEHKRIKPQESNLIISLYESGAPINYICQALKKSKTVITNHLRIKGYKEFCQL